MKTSKEQRNLNILIDSPWLRLRTYSGWDVSGPYLETSGGCYEITTITPRNTVDETRLVYKCDAVYHQRRPQSF